MENAAKQFLQKATRQYNKNFIDKLRINVKGGAGGKGKPSIGGNGGRGGNVFMVASKKPELKLNAIKHTYPKKRFTATAGGDSGKEFMVGRDGHDIYVEVPHGVDIYDATSNAFLGEITQKHQKLKVARGGDGASFRNKFLPQKGQNRNLLIDLKVISDVGFIGFPNAGKSSLLRKLSKAKPVVSPFPFTTIKPEIGVMEYEDRRQIKLADLPGIIDGAHLNEGRGHVFLKHAERTAYLLIVADVDGFQLSIEKKHFSCFETIQLLLKELMLYDENMLKKPRILAINKMDLPDADHLFKEAMDELEEYNTKCLAEMSEEDEETAAAAGLNFHTIVPVSAKSGLNIDYLKSMLRHAIDETTPEAQRIAAKREEEAIEAEIEQSAPGFGKLIDGVSETNNDDLKSL